MYFYVILNLRFYLIIDWFLMIYAICAVIKYKFICNFKYCVTYLKKYFWKVTMNIHT